MKISVVVCTYNYGHLLPDALRSVAAQTCDDFELLVVDDGSTDNTREVVESFRPHFHHFRYLQRRHAGPADARNAGVQAATGTHIAFLDADDLWSPDYLRSIQEAFGSCPQADLAFCEGIVIRSDSGVINEARFHRELPSLCGPVHSPRELFALIQSFSPSGMIFSKGLYDRIGPFDVRSFGWFSEDIDWTFRALLSGAFCACVKRRLYLYRRHRDNLTNEAARAFRAWLDIYSETLAEGRRDPQIETLARSTIRSHSVRFLPTCSTAEGRELLRRGVTVLGGDPFLRAVWCGTFLGLADCLKVLKGIKQVLHRWFRRKPAIKLSLQPRDLFEALESHLRRSQR
ncbi:MAG TPA: glycosyltransferase family 2 protein [Terriglobia bacterium]|jgi:glycosyltransferase involved in cell wall biosynthesis|nr:glycosyltransferase family 2 protein [Terriglobia bacterium]